jgi:glycosyltransferase involved in cell wall biosynthesis
MSPAISVIVPAYKHGEYILDTLNSVFAQTYRNFEVIVINDGSPDNTADILRPLVDSGRIRYFDQPNGGQPSARNRGLNEAKGQYIAYLDDDDLWPPDKLQWQAAALDSDPDLLVVYGKCVNLGERPEDSTDPDDFPTGMIYDDFCISNHIRSPGQSLIRAGALRAIGGFDVEIKGADDWDLWIRLAKKGRFRYENRIALHCRNHDSNASSNLWAMYMNCMRVVQKHFGYERTRYRLARGHVKRYVAHGYVEAVKRHAGSGRRAQALKSLLIAWMLDPALVFRRARKKLAS